MIGGDLDVIAITAASCSNVVLSSLFLNGPTFLRRAQCNNGNIIVVPYLENDYMIMVLCLFLIGVDGVVSYFYGRNKLTEHLISFSLLVFFISLCFPSLRKYERFCIFLMLYGSLSLSEK